jgi:ABC-type spermidine/putrescine transport system, permease component I
LKITAYNKKTFFMLLPAILTFVIFFFIPLYYTLKLSLFSFTGDFIGFDAYVTAFNNPSVMKSMYFSFYLAIVSTVVAAVISVVIAMAMRKTFFGKKVAMFVYQLNIPIPYIAFALMMILLLTNTGYLSRILFNMGIISSALDFPLLINDTNGIAILLTYILKFLPFIGMSVLAVLQTSVAEYEEQAATLGAGRIRTFIHVTLPMILPAIAATTVITFAFAFGTYEIPALLGGINPMALPVLTYYNLNSYNPSDWPVSYALANLMTVVIIVLTAAYAFFMARQEVRR